MAINSRLFKTCPSCRTTYYRNILIDGEHPQNCPFCDSVPPMAIAKTIGGILIGGLVIAAVLIIDPEAITGLLIGGIVWAAAWAHSIGGNDERGH